MMYFFFLVLRDLILPQLGQIIGGVYPPIMSASIQIAGILILLSVVGVHISNNIGVTVLNALLRGMGYIGSTLIQGIGWALKKTIEACPKIFQTCRDRLSDMGVYPVLATIIAGLVTFLFVIIVI